MSEECHVADTLRLGDSGPEVAALQQRLVGLGYQLEVTSSYDDHTYEAVKGYQQHSRAGHLPDIGHPMAGTGATRRPGVSPPLRPGTVPVALEKAFPPGPGNG